MGYCVLGAMRPLGSNQGARHKDLEGGRTVAISTQGVSSLHWCSSRQGSEPPHDHHSPGLPRLFGEHWWSLCRGHQPPFCLSSFLMLFHCPSLLTGSDLCPLFLGSLKDCGEGRSQLRKRKLETKCCFQGLLFPTLQHPFRFTLGSPTWATEPVSLE